MMGCIQKFFRAKAAPKIYQSSVQEPIIAIVVGHNKKKQGAVNYLNESEYTFNSRIARKLQIRLRQTLIPSLVMFRGEGSYAKQSERIAEMCSSNNAFLSLHLHFNSAHSETLAVGCEVLVLDTVNELDNEFGEVFTEQLVTRYDFVDRGVKTITEGHAGYGMMNEVRSAGTIPVLVEPCFAHHRHNDSRLIFEHEDQYVDVLLHSLMAIYRPNDE